METIGFVDVVSVGIICLLAGGLVIGLIQIAEWLSGWKW